MVENGSLGRILLIVGVAVGAHVTVVAIRRLGERIISGRLSKSPPKVRTIGSIVQSALVFVVYFAAVGLALDELKISLKAYLASASVVGLAIGFGAQGFVQDVVTGVTLIFADLFDVGDMVEISGQAGVVSRIGLRFTTLVNSMGAEISIPNRTIANVTNYPRGYVRCLADVTLPGDADRESEAEKAIEAVAISMHEQFPGVLLTPPSIEKRETTSAGRRFLRVNFPLLPGRADVIEKSFKPEIVQVLQGMDGTYAEWMVAVNYEVERNSVIPMAGGGK